MSPMLKWGLYVVLVGSTLATLLIATQSLGSLFGIYVIKKVKPNGGMPAPPCSENSLCAKAHRALLRAANRRNAGPVVPFWALNGERP